MKKLLSILTVSAMTITMLVGCGSKSEETKETSEVVTDDTEAKTTDDKTYKIGVLQLVEHAALDASNEGFIAALEDAGINYEVDQQNAQGDQSACQTISEKLVNDGNDLILAIATPAAQAVAGSTTDIPILVTAVTDPAESGLVESNEEPGGNVSGTSDLTPVTEQIDLLQKLLPDAKTVGIIYCSAESNSELQVEMATKACEDAGLDYETFSVSSSNEIQSVVESMVGKVDAIYAPTDNTIAAGMATVSMIANDNNLPIICGEKGMVEAGGLATYGIDYYKLGYMAGEQAVQILTEGADISKMPIGYLEKEQCELATNEEAAEALGIDLSVLE